MMDNTSLQHYSDRLLARGLITLAEANILRDQDRRTEALAGRLEAETGYPDMRITCFP